jgi:hypothetical protein
MFESYHVERCVKNPGLLTGARIVEKLDAIRHATNMLEEYNKHNFSVI